MVVRLATIGAVGFEHIELHLLQYDGMAAALCRVLRERIPRARPSRRHELSRTDDLLVHPRTLLHPLRPVVVADHRADALYEVDRRPAGPHQLGEVLPR